MLVSLLNVINQQKDSCDQVSRVRSGLKMQSQPKLEEHLWYENNGSSNWVLVLVVVVRGVHLVIGGPFSIWYCVGSCSSDDISATSSDCCLLVDGFFYRWCILWRLSFLFLVPRPCCWYGYSPTLTCPSAVSITAFASLNWLACRQIFLLSVTRLVVMESLVCCTRCRTLVHRVCFICSPLVSWPTHTRPATAFLLSSVFPLLFHALLVFFLSLVEKVILRIILCVWIYMIQLYPYNSSSHSFVRRDSCCWVQGWSIDNHHVLNYVLSVRLIYLF